MSAEFVKFRKPTSPENCQNKKSVKDQGSISRSLEKIQGQVRPKAGRVRFEGHYGSLQVPQEEGDQSVLLRAQGQRLRALHCQKAPKSKSQLRSGSNCGSAVVIQRLLCMFWRQLFFKCIVRCGGK